MAHLRKYHLKNRLFVGLIAILLAACVLLLALSIEPGKYPLGSAFLFTFYAIIQLGLGVLYFILYLDRYSNFVLFTAYTVGSVIIWIVVNGFTIYESSVINTFPYVPGKDCNNVSKGPNYCPELRQVADTMIAELFMLMGISFVGFAAGIAAFVTRLRERFRD